MRKKHWLLWSCEDLNFCGRGPGGDEGAGWTKGWARGKCFEGGRMERKGKGGFGRMFDIKLRCIWGWGFWGIRFFCLRFWKFLRKIFFGWFQLDNCLNFFRNFAINFLISWFDYFLVNLVSQ